MLYGKVTIPKNDCKNNEFYSPIISAHEVLFNGFKGKKRFFFFLKKRKEASENIQGHSCALSTF